MPWPESSPIKGEDVAFADSAATRKDSTSVGGPPEAACPQVWRWPEAAAFLVAAESRRLCSGCVTKHEGWGPRFPNIHIRTLIQFLDHNIVLLLCRQILLSSASALDVACGAPAPALIYGITVLQRQILYMTLYTCMFMCGALAPDFLLRCFGAR